VHRAAHGAVCVHLVLDADKANAEMIEFFERRQQMLRTACETVAFPDQNTVDFPISCLSSEH